MKRPTRPVTPPAPGAASSPAARDRRQTPAAAATRAVVNSHNQAWASGELRAVLAHYHPQLCWHDHYAGLSYHGASLRDHVQRVLARSKLDSLRYLDAVCADGDTAVLQYTETIRSAHGDALLQIRACDVVRVQDGLIVQIDEYAVPMDPHPHPGAAGSPRDPTGQRARKPSAAAERLGLGARALGYLLADLQQHLASARPYLNPALTLTELAQATGYSRNQISFALNHGLGQSFYAWVNQTRVQHVLQQYAVAPHQPVLALARAAGFRSASTFYQAFRAQTGLAPGAYFRQTPLAVTP